MLEQHNNILFMINQQNKFGIFNEINRVHFISEKKENGGSGLTIHLFTHSHQTSTAQHLRHARHLTILPSRATSAFLRNTQLTSQDQLSCTLLENMWKISEHILFFRFLPEYIELSHCSSAEDDGKIIVCQNVWCTCGYCHGHFAFVIAVVIEFTCCVMCLRNFIGIEVLVCLLAFSVIFVMFIFLAF